MVGRKVALPLAALAGSAYVAIGQLRSARQDAQELAFERRLEAAIDGPKSMPATAQNLRAIADARREGKETTAEARCLYEPSNPHACVDLILSRLPSHRRDAAAAPKPGALDPTDPEDVTFSLLPRNAAQSQLEERRPEQQQQRRWAFLGDDPFLDAAMLDYDDDDDRDDDDDDDSPRSHRSLFRRYYEDARLECNCNVRSNWGQPCDPLTYAFGYTPVGENERDAADAEREGPVVATMRQFWEEDDEEGNYDNGGGLPCDLPHRHHTYRLLSCPSTCAAARPFAEFLPVHYARDVRLQSEEHGRTTQSNVAAYLALRAEETGSRPAACVVSVGRNDLGVGEERPNKAAYVDNVRAFLGMLRLGCEHVVWVTPRSPRPSEPWLSRPGAAAVSAEEASRIVEMDRTLREWNAAVHSMLRRDFAESATVVDVLQSSKATVNTEGGWMEWNEKLGDMLGAAMEGRHAEEEEEPAGAERAGAAEKEDLERIPRGQIERQDTVRRERGESGCVAGVRGITEGSGVGDGVAARGDSVLGASVAGGSIFAAVGDNIGLPVTGPEAPSVGSSVGSSILPGSFVGSGVLTVSGVGSGISTGFDVGVGSGVGSGGVADLPWALVSHYNPKIS